MKRLFKIIFTVISTLLILICAILIMIPHFLNHEHFKDHIETILMARFQREVKIHDVSITFLPDIHIQLSQFSLGDAAGFGQVPQVQAKSTDIFLEILPLIRKEIVIKRISFQGMSIYLTYLENNQNNWDDLIENLSTTQPPQSSPTEIPKTSLELKSPGSISIKNADVVYDDQRKNHRFKISGLNYQCTGFMQNIVHLEFDMTAKIPHKHGNCYFDSSVDLHGRARQQQFSINDAHLQMSVNGYFPGNHFFKTNLNSTIALSASHGALELSNLLLNFNDMPIKGTFFARNLFEQPAICGHLTTHTENFHALLAQNFGFDGPVGTEISFQTRGQTLISLLKNLKLDIWSHASKPGKLVVPDKFMNNNNAILKLLKQLNIHLHLAYLESPDKNFAYGFQTHLDGNMLRDDDAIDISFKTQSHVLINSELSDICFNRGKFDIQAVWTRLSQKPYFIKGDISGNMKNKQLTMENLSVAGPDINGHLQMKLRPWVMENKVNIEIKQVKKVLSAFSLPIPRFYDPDVCNQIDFKGKIYLTTDNMHVMDMTLVMDDAEASGAILYQYHPPAIDFHLKGKNLDYNRHWIRWPKKQSNKNRQKLTPRLTINGDIEFQDLRVFNVKIDHGRMNYQAKDRIYRMSKMTGSMYDGKFMGHWTFNFQPKTPKSELMLHCKDIQVGGFLRDYLEFNRIRGKLSMKTSLSWDFSGNRLIRNSLNGNAKVKLSDGVINGIQIVPKVVQKEIQQKHKEHAKINIPKQQPIEMLTGHVRFRNGRMQNSDLMAYSKGLRVKGKGGLDTVKEEVDYTFQVGIPHLPVIPYQVKGSIRKPEISLDASAFLKIAVTDFFNQATNLGTETIKDTLHFSGNALDIDTKPLQKTVEKSSEAIKQTLQKGTGTIKETLTIGSDILHAGKSAIKVLGDRVKSLFLGDSNELDEER